MANRHRSSQPQKCDGLRLQRSPKLQQIRKKSLVINETIGLLFPDLVMVYAPKKTSQSPKDHPARCREGCADADGIRRRGKVLHLLGCGVSLVNEPARVDFLLVWNLISSYIILYHLIILYLFVSDIKDRFKMIRHFVEMLIYPLNPLYLHNAALQQVSFRS